MLTSSFPLYTFLPLNKITIDKIAFFAQEKTSHLESWFKSSFLNFFYWNFFIQYITRGFPSPSSSLDLHSPNSTHLRKQTGKQNSPPKSLTWHLASGYMDCNMSIDDLKDNNMWLWEKTQYFSWSLDYLGMNFSRSIHWPVNSIISFLNSWLIFQCVNFYEEMF